MRRQTRGRREGRVVGWCLMHQARAIMRCDGDNSSAVCLELLAKRGLGENFDSIEGAETSWTPAQEYQRGLENTRKSGV